MKALVVLIFAAILVAGCTAYQKQGFTGGFSETQLVMAFEEEFGIEIPDDAAESIQTFCDAVKFITEKST